MSEAEALLIRADAGPTIGAGHVMRCLALAQGWRRAGGGAVTCASASLPEALAARLTGAGVGVRRLDVVPGNNKDARATLEVAAALGARALVIDGYGFGEAFQRALKPAGATLVVDDAGHIGPLDCDLLVDQNIGAMAASYAQVAPGTELLLGTRYAMLREEFVLAPRPAREASGRRVLVTLGGSDPAGLSVPVTRALTAAAPGAAPIDGPIEVTVVLGGGHPEARATAAELRALGAEVLTDVRDMPGLIGAADLAVSAAGSTCWELCYLGLPALLVVVADNQRTIASGLDAAGAALSLGWHAEVDTARLARETRRLLADPRARATMADAGRALVDGRGADRVAARLLEHARRR